MKEHTPRKSRKPTSPRTRELARIHMAAQQLQLDDDTYRALLERVTGFRSAAKLNDKERRDVIQELVRLGAKLDQRSQHHPGCPKNVKEKPMLRKVEALLADAKRPWAYAHSMAKRMFDCTRVEWLRDDQLHRLIAALQTDQLRHKKGMQ